MNIETINRFPEIEQAFEYPGQPLVVALAIMKAFPSASTALKRSETGCPAAVECSSVPGAGDMAHAACDVLRHFQTYRDLKGTTALAYHIWQSCVGPGTGNHESAFLPGILKAKPMEGEFVRALTQWNWS